MEKTLILIIYNNGFDLCRALVNSDPNESDYSIMIYQWDNDLCHCRDLHHSDI